MRKKMIAALLSVITCTTLLGSTVFAQDLGVGQKNGFDVDGDSEIINPIYQVVVPTTLLFGVDAFEQNAASQIYSVDYPIINKSNVNVKVDVALMVSEKVPSSSNPIVFKNSASDVAHTGSAKEVWFAAGVPSTIAETTGTPVPVMIDTKGLYKVVSTANTTGVYVVAANTSDAEAAAAQVDPTVSGAGLSATTVDQGPIDVTGTFTYATGADYKSYTMSSAPQTLTFALEKATYGINYYDTTVSTTESKKAFTATAANETGSATFRFHGAVNDAAIWAADDFTAKASYSFNGLSDTNYTTLTTGANQVEISTGVYAHGLVKKQDAAPSVSNLNVTYSKATGMEIPIDLGFGSLAATGVSSITSGANASNATTPWTGTNSYANGKLTINPVADGWALAGSGTTKAMVVTMNDAAQTKFTFVVTIAN